MPMKQTIRGRVVSDKMDKTVVVAVESNRRHPIYKKLIRREKKYLAHDEANECRVGDWVDLIETRPLSARKRWCVVGRIKSKTGGLLAAEEGGQ